MPEEVSEEFSHRLSRREIARFHDEGFLGPYTLCTPDSMAGIRERIEREVFTTEGAVKGHRYYARHLGCRVVYDLCAHRAIVERVASLYGPDLMLWNSAFWVKEPNDPAIPWHQDIHYWPMEPPVNITAWIAITEVAVDNACVRLIPGSNKEILPHVETVGGEYTWEKMADPALVQTDKALDMELRPGQFFLFNDRMLHSSLKNESDKRRIGLGARISVPFVKLYQDRLPLFPGHKVIIIRGEDRMGFNEAAAPPDER
jgi:ectoine hydroxylase-related dioxygenase (phytanoyl-CoA dioxygenase family)